MLKKKINIFWFRNDLRLEDNRGLYEALRSGLRVLPLFIFDTDILSQLPDKCDRRVDFIHQALKSGFHTSGTLQTRIENFLNKRNRLR